jgi:hypothetical protein
MFMACRQELKMKKVLSGLGALAVACFFEFQTMFFDI